MHVDIVVFVSTNTLYIIIDLVTNDIMRRLNLLKPYNIIENCSNNSSTYATSLKRTRYVYFTSADLFFPSPICFSVMCFV